MAYNFTIKLPDLLIKASGSGESFKSRYLGIIVWLSENLQKFRDYEFSNDTTYISYYRNIDINWHVPVYLYLNNEEDLLLLKLKFLT